MTPEAYARCITHTTGKEHTYSRQQLADMYRAMRVKVNGRTAMSVRIHEVLHSNGPMIVREIASALDTYEQLVRATVLRNASLEKVPGSVPAAYRVAALPRV